MTNQETFALGQKRNINRLHRGVVTPRQIDAHAKDNKAREAFERSLQLGFETTWEVSADYVVKDGKLWSIGQTTEYPPMGHKELPGEMAKLSPGDEGAVLQFAQTYGVFGYAKLRHIAPEEKPPGEPLDWIWAHARGLKLCLGLSDYLQTRDEEKLEVYLDTHRASKTWRGLRMYEAEIAYREQIVQVQWARDAGESAVDLARCIRIELINENIRGIRRAFQDVDGSDQSYFVFSALVEAAYWQLADMMTAHEPIQRCTACGAPFIQTDPRQRFCLPKRNQKESACAIRFRVRKHREQSRQS